MKHYLFLAAMLCASICTFGQADEALMRFAREKDSLLTAAYDAKDAKAGKVQVDAMQAAYSKLPVKDQETYHDFIMNGHYNMACLYSVTGDKKNAIASLVKSAYTDYDHMLEDTDLDALRNEPDFKAFLYKAKNIKSRHLVTLQKDAQYKPDNNKWPAFTYQDAGDEHLVALRKAYKLDSVVGKGSEITQIINLMHWVHNTIQHDGSHGNPDGDLNAMNFITVCKDNSKTCNCRGLSITLNELYLAMGYKSRYVTCLPKDTTDSDCHVITAVFSKQLHKWVWMDPTFDAYVMNEEGELLGIQEVHDRLVASKPLVLNPEANWNHKATQSKRHYLLDYMAKNLYRLECNINSAYNCDTYTEGKIRQFAELKPAGYMPGPAVWKNKSGTYVMYHTSDPAKFWAEPE